MNIAINELFYSIQGEGPNAGTPAVFIRFQGCQLRCPWCDTGSSLDPEGPHQDMTVQQVLNAINRWPCLHVVITGGDPTYQMDALDVLSHTLVGHGYTLEIETSGIKQIPEIICRRFAQINVGLKLPNSDQPFQMSYYRQAIQHYQQMNNAIFKIVITGQQDIDFLMNRLIASKMLEREKTYLMPLGDTIEQQNANAGYVIAVCKQENFRFSPRLHIMFGLQ